jgi:hypothetical protein
MQAAERRQEGQSAQFAPRRTTVRVEVPRVAESHHTTIRSSDVRRTRAVVARVGPWSVFKISLIYSFIGMLAVLGGLAILYVVLGATGILADIERLLNAVGVGHHFRFHGGWIFSHLFAIGLILVVVVSLIASVMAFLYNAVSDLFGGIELTLESPDPRASERGVRRPHVPAEGNGHGTPEVMVWDRKPLRDASGL